MAELKKHCIHKEMIPGEKITAFIFHPKTKHVKNPKIKSFVQVDDAFLVSPRIHNWARKYNWQKSSLKKAELIKSKHNNFETISYYKGFFVFFLSWF